MRNIKFTAVLLSIALFITPAFSSLADTQGVLAEASENNVIGPTVGAYGNESYPGMPAETTPAKTEEELLLEKQYKALLEEQLKLQAEAIHAFEIGNFFKDSVLVGDSVALGFSNYSVKNAALPIFQNLKFLTRGSYSVHNAFSAISSKSCHPIYQGEQKYAWDALKLMGAKHIYTFFGLNDLYAGVDNTVAKYLEFIARVQAEIPDIEITIISTTPMYRGSEKKNLNNANIRALNAQMAALAAENGWGYVDIASRLCDSDGCLSKVYCSDSYVHETNAAYQVWQAALEEYAEAHLNSVQPESEDDQEQTTETQ
jgi:lysophospholipase L1-like esterase